MFENVYGFTVKFPSFKRNGKRAYSEIVISKLHELGYTDARGEIVDMSEFGVPQRRKRFIVIATRDGLADATVGAGATSATGGLPGQEGHAG